jgi:hypothetical protein
MYKCIAGILFCVAVSVHTQPADSTFHIAISSRIDTTNTEVHSVLTTWMNYLRSRPDSLTNNPYWVQSERQQLPEYDLARNWIFQSPDMIRRYRPTILSIENEGALRCIRTMFTYADNNGVAPLAFHRVYAEQHSGQWYIKGAWSVLTQNWNRTTVGKITYVYSPQHPFSTLLARKASRWCDSLASAFELNLTESVVYVCENRDELARVIGLDYFIAPPHGITYQENAMMFSGLGTPWHPHELAHLVFAQYNTTHMILKEGIATWVGGSLGDSYQTLVYQFVKKYSTTPFSVSAVLTNPVEESQTFYTVGAVLCNAVYDIGGAESVRLLLSSPDSNSGLFATLSHLLNIQPDKLDMYIMRKAKQYAANGNK